MSDYVRYSMDAAQSQFTVHAFASGLAAVVAHNPKFAIRDFSGEARFVSDTLRDASIQVRIKATSLELMDEVSEYDRGEIDRVMFNEVLEVSRFPEIVYTSTQITATRLSENLYATTIAGKLSAPWRHQRVGFLCPSGHRRRRTARLWKFLGEAERI